MGSLLKSGQLPLRSKHRLPQKSWHGPAYSPTSHHALSIAKVHNSLCVPVRGGKIKMMKPYSHLLCVAWLTPAQAFACVPLGARTYAATTLVCPHYIGTGRTHAHVHVCTQTNRGCTCKRPPLPVLSGEGLRNSILAMSKKACFIGLKCSHSGGGLHHGNNDKQKSEKRGSLWFSCAMAGRGSHLSRNL